MRTSHCKVCGGEVVRAGHKPGVFCSLECKAEWQRAQKPVDRAWLYQKYVIEELSTYAIGRLVSRDPKRVYEWLNGYGIPTRQRGWTVAPSDQLHQQKDWLEREYGEKRRSAKEIADEVGVVENTIFHFLHKHGIPRRDMREIRAHKHWGLSGKRNGMYGLRGPESSNWKGGHTPERQAFYASAEWRELARRIWARDKATCRRCGKKSKGKKDRFAIHHITSFAVKRLRMVSNNLILLCPACHRWVHSKANVENVFRKSIMVQKRLF